MTMTINNIIQKLNSTYFNFNLDDIIFDEKIINNKKLSSTKSFVNVYDDNDNVITTISNNKVLHIIEERLDKSVYYISELKYFGAIKDTDIKEYENISEVKVCVPSTFCFSKPSIKSKINYPAYLNDKIPQINDECESFFHTNDGYFFKKHFNINHTSISDVATMFLNTPYLWGGTGHYGIDCSGLVQNCFKAIGIDMQRDAYQQEKNKNFKKIAEKNIKQNTVVFWPGHVGIMINKTKIIHANATSMNVKIDNLSDVKKHIKKIEKNNVSSYLEYIHD